MFVVVHGGGKGCELERQSIIPLIKELLVVKQSWNKKANWFHGFGLKYVKWENFFAKALTPDAPQEILSCSDWSELTFGGEKTVKFSVLNCGLVEFKGDYTESVTVAGRPSYRISTGGVQTCHYCSGKWFFSYDCAGVRYQARADEHIIGPPQNGWEAVGHDTATPQVLTLGGLAFWVQGSGSSEFNGLYVDASHEPEKNRVQNEYQRQNRKSFFRMTGGKAPTCFYSGEAQKWYLVNNFDAGGKSYYQVNGDVSDLPPTSGWEAVCGNGAIPAPKIVHKAQIDSGGMKAAPVPLADFTYHHGWILTDSLRAST